MSESHGNTRYSHDMTVNKDLPKAVYITWAQTSSRSDSTAPFFNARSFRITSFNSHSKILLPWRYLIAATKTLYVLLREQPKVVFVQNPPTMSVMLIWLYARFRRVSFIPDSHCSVFNSRKWRRFLWIYKYIAKQALTNIAHNHRYVEEIKAWGAHSVNLGSVPRKMQTTQTYTVRPGFNVMFPCSFQGDEPVSEVIKAARTLTDVNFYITGNFRRAPRELVDDAPSNTIFTGFLSNEEYVALMKACTAVMCLTTRDDTNQSGAYEAIAVNRPIILSDWALLREIYNKGAVFANNDSVSLARAVLKIRDNYIFYLEQIALLREETMAIWESNYCELRAAILNGSKILAS